MSLEQPFDYQDAAAEILDEIEQNGSSLKDVLLKLEKATIVAALKSTKSNIAGAARLLGLNRSTLQARTRVLEVFQ